MNQKREIIWLESLHLTLHWEEFQRPLKLEKYNTLETFKPIVSVEKVTQMTSQLKELTLEVIVRTKFGVRGIKKLYTSLQDLL